MRRANMNRIVKGLCIGTALSLFSSYGPENGNFSFNIKERNALRMPSAYAAEASGTNTAGKSKPNYIIILADDQGYEDLGCYGSPNIKTPNIDKIASEGMKFTDFYAAPVCTPSRASLITGCYPERLGFNRNQVLFPNQADKGIHPDEKTIAELLKEQGYATGMVGKWHLGTACPEFLPTGNGFDYYYGVPYSNDMGMNVPNGQYHSTEKGIDLFGGTPLLRNEEIIEQPADNNLFTQRYTEESIKYIKENKDKSFFLYLAHTMPHVPLGASDAFRGKSARGAYGDAIEEIDWSVGEILRTLKECNIDDNTVVVYTSDNGPWLAKGQNGGSALPLRGGKTTLFEGGIRVPAIMRWPGKIPANTVNHEIVSNMDILPTFVKLAGGEIPAERKIDGKDISSIILGEANAKSPHEAYYAYVDDNYWAIRKDNWKLFNNGELYDLGNDISEKTNVAAQNPMVVNSLKKMMDDYIQDIKTNKRPNGDAWYNDNKVTGPMVSSDLGDRLRYEGEKAAVTGPCKFVPVAHASGGVHIGFLTADSIIAFKKVDGGSGGSKEISIGYGALEDCSITLTVNGAEVGSIPMKSTGGWQKYDTVKRTVTLKPGLENDVVLTLPGATKVMNIDYIDILKDAGASAGSNENSGNQVKEKTDKYLIMMIDKEFALLNNNKVPIEKGTSDVKPVVVEGRTLVPLRFISEAVGAQVGWEEESGKITITQDSNKVEIILGSTDMLVNGMTVKLDVPAQTFNDRTFVPLRALVEALGRDVFWDNRGIIAIGGKDNNFDELKLTETIDEIIEMFQ